jgi:hypothetical protein
MTKRKALVTGATGVVGRYLLMGCFCSFSPR